MRVSLFYKILLLSLCWCLVLGAVCPTGEVKVTNFPVLNGDDFTDSSKGYDSMYEIKKDPNSDTYYLYGYYILEIETNETAYFEVQQAKRAAKLTWDIIFVSEPGNCMIVADRPYLYLFQTSQNDFFLTQTLKFDAYSNIHVNDECSIARVWFEDGTEKVFVKSKQNTDIVFPAGSTFDASYDYGLDSSKKLKKGSLTGITELNIGLNTLEDTPVSIFNRKDLRILILLTKSSQTDKYTVTILNTINDKLLYTRSWASGNYSQFVTVDQGFDWNFFMIKDQNGYLLLLQIIRHSKSVVTVNEITIEKPDYCILFAQGVVVSLDSLTIITYVENKLYYFQVYDNVLYFLTMLHSNLQMEALRYQSLSSKKAPLIPTFIEPGQYKNCYYKYAEDSDQEKSKNLIDDNQRSFIKNEDGKVIKCQPECLACKTNGKCEVCSLGYSLDMATETCVFCLGCRACFTQSPDKCLSCFQPYVLNEVTLKCERAKCTEAFCLSCFNNGTCQQCIKGYSVVDGKCQKCQEGCAGCVEKGSDTCDLSIIVNTTCNVGYVFSPVLTAYPCVECATGCTSCSLTDISNCTSCNEGYYFVLSSTNAYRCLSCMVNCKSCTSGDVCDKCIRGYRVSSNGKCIEKCDSTCLTCSQTDKFKCLSCFAGTTLQNGLCVVDLSCNATKKCTTCADGYALVYGQCLKCTYTDSNCQGCLSTDLSICSACKYGFYMDETHTCIQCKASCTGCLQEDACFSCNAGFYLARTSQSVTGKCLACVQECKTCNQLAELCTSCDTGYFLDGSKCISLVHVDYTLTVNSPVEQMVNLARVFRMTVIGFSDTYSVDPSQPLDLSTNDISIDKLESGSTLVSGKISTFNKTQSDKIAQNINLFLPGTPLDFGYSIIGVSAVTVPGDSSGGGSGGSGGNSNPDPLPTQSGDTFISFFKANIGIVLAIAIPLGLLLLITIIVAAVKLYKRNNKEEEDDEDVATTTVTTVTDNVSHEQKYSQYAYQVPASSKYIIDDGERI